MAGKSLVIVESPTKARTINKFLGKDYIIKASNGHIRDLPNGAAEIPANFKKEKWARIGVNVQNQFEPLYVIPKSKKDNIKSLKEDLKKVNVLYLATDEDREGESISWHLLETLKPKIPFKRLVFHEITKEAITESLNSPREIDLNLVKAQETRRILDRLYGYEVSPLLWKKITRNLSAGRVQSVTIRLLVERERERIAFKSSNYWTLKSKFQKQDPAATPRDFEAELSNVGDKRVALGKDFDPATGKLIDPTKFVALNKEQIENLRKELANSKVSVSSVEEKPFTGKPLPPFITSTLQQEANAKLRFSAKRTMTVAQHLYENGFITYMRTDSTTLSQQAIVAARNLISKEYGAEYLPKEPRAYATKVKNAQEAHEAIRPAGEHFASIDEVHAKLGAEAGKLYELIWKRTIACQMQNSTGTHISVHVDCGVAKFRATGKTIKFPGYLRAYVEGSDDPEEELQEQEKILPKLTVGEYLNAIEHSSVEKITQPPARYTEGSLIKELEKRGIGRPSTWATVVELVLSRDYAFKKGTAITPTYTAFAVVNLMEKYFTDLVDYQFTADLEDDLDAISRGEANTLEYLTSFYFGDKHPGLKKLISNGEEQIDPREVCGVSIGKTADDKNIEVRIGRYGPFITDGELRTSVPDGLAPDELTLEKAQELLTSAQKGTDTFGFDPETGLPIYLKTGPYGPYVQLGDGEDNKKPKMVSLLKSMRPEELTVEQALKLLSFPRTLGEHPESGNKVIAALGPYGPYVKSGTESRSIRLDEFDPMEINLEQAVELLARPKGVRKTVEPKTLKELGAHPLSGATVSIKDGRYGPYITDGETNASLDKDIDPDSITFDHALNLLDQKKSRGPVKKTKRRKKK